MRALFFPIGLLASTISVATAADMPVKATVVSVDARWNAVFDTDTRFYSWTGTRGFAPTAAGASGSGWQVYSPFALGITGKPTDEYKLEFAIRSGYVSSSQTTPFQSGSVSTFTDTSLASTFTYLGFGGIQPFLSVNANLPTGTASIIGPGINARMDPDLVGISLFGEGFNIGPTVGANFAITENLLITPSVGYTYRGAYDRDNIANPSTFTPFAGATARLDPGDILTANIGLSYAQGAFAFQANFAAMFETNTNVNGILLGLPFNGALYRTGNRYLASATAAYGWTDYWTTVATVSWTHIDANKVLPADLPPLVAELFNSNNNVFQARLDNNFKVGAFTFGPTGSYMHRDNNSWNPTTFQFVAAKTKWTGGGFTTWNVTDASSITARLEGMWITEDPNPGLLLPALPARGVMGSVGGNIKF